MSKRHIPFLDLRPAHDQVEKELSSAFQRVLDRQWFLLGAELEQFERAYADFNKVGFAIGTSNGLDALYLSLKVLGVGPGDEVIVPANTFVASALAVSHLGANPVFVEPRLETYNLDPEKVEAAISPRTKALMPVHLYGQACEMESLAAIAEAHGLKIVEDNAQAQGATFEGKLTGSWGILNATSFYPGKNLGALGDAGAVTTNEEELAEKVKKWRNYGSAEKYHHEVPGHNMRMDELQAAFLRVKLQQLPQWTKERQKIAQWYLEALGDIGELILPQTHEKASHVYHLFVIRSDNRDALQAHLAGKGIASLIHYPIPPYLQKAYYTASAPPAGSFPITDTISKTALSLPLWPGMDQNHVDQIAEALKSFAR